MADATLVTFVHVRRFMIVFGLLSTSIDLATFAVLRIGYDTNAKGLRTGWFLVSVLTEIVAMLFLRTSRSVSRSRPSSALMISSVIVYAITFVLVTTDLGQAFRFEGLPAGVILGLVALVVLYAAMTEILKKRLSSRIEVFHPRT